MPLDGALAATLALLACVELVKAALWLLIIVVIAQAILSWTAPDGRLAGVLNALTFRFLAPIRRLVPPLGGTLDLSPLILIVHRPARADAAGALARGRRADIVPLRKLMTVAWCREDGDGLVVLLHVQPGARRTEIAGVHGAGAQARLKVRVAAPPADGKANAELLRFLAAAFGVSLRAVTLLRGETSRQKTVQIAQPARRPDRTWGGVDDG